jgi:5-methylcytosine-specific restriction enzyme A
MFTSPKGKIYGYQDRWLSPDTIFQYTGEGQLGDMELVRGNLAIKNHRIDGRQLHLFQQVSSGKYQYIGEFEFIEHQIISGEDTDQSKRKMIVFKLRKI